MAVQIGQLIDRLAFHQRLTGRQLHGEVPLAVVGGLHVDQLGEFAHQLIPLIQQAVGIIDAVNGVGRNLPVQIRDGP